MKRKMNKKGFLTRHWIVAFVVFVALMGLYFVAFQGLAIEYSNQKVINENFNSTYNKFNVLEENAGEMLEEARSGKGLSVVGAVTGSFYATFTIVQIIFSSLLLPGAMLKQFMIDVGAPSIIGNIMFSLPIIIITVIIVLVVISSISQGKL